MPVPSDVSSSSTATASGVSRTVVSSTVNLQASQNLKQGQDSLQTDDDIEAINKALKLNSASGTRKPDYAEEWIKRFCFIKTLLIIFGQWPLTLEIKQFKQKQTFVFDFNGKSLSTIVFIWTLIFNLYGLFSGAINVVDILMKDKVMPDYTGRTKTQILEQGLVERHTMIVMIMLGSYGLNVITLAMVFSKRHTTAEMFNKWMRFLGQSKLHTTLVSSYTYAGLAMGNACVVAIAITLLIIFRISASFIGGPTVISMMFLRHFLPETYLEKGTFRNSLLHIVMHSLGIFLYFYVTLTSQVSVYFFLWILKTTKNAIDCWSSRLNLQIDKVHNEGANSNLDDFDGKERMDFNHLYSDHVGLVRMISWLNELVSGILEPWFLFFTVRVVYQMYLAALVIQGNGKPLNKANLGKYFVRKRDYLPAILITYENTFLMITVLCASSWLDDSAYYSYDELREISLIKGPSTDKESLFFLSMFQSYISTTRLSIYAGGYFTIDRYTMLHVLSAIMSNFLVVYQFRPLFDTDTTDFPQVRSIVGKFLTSFEGLPKNHLNPITDAERQQYSP